MNLILMDLKGLLVSIPSEEKGEGDPFGAIEFGDGRVCVAEMTTCVFSNIGY